MARRGFGIRKTIDNIKNDAPASPITRALENASTYVVLYLRAQWKKGFGGTGATLQAPPISKSYAKRKGKKLGEGSAKIDMLSPAKDDHMTQFFGVKERRGRTYTIGFTSLTANNKARYNYNRRPQFFDLSEAVKSKVRSYFRGLTK